MDYKTVYYSSILCFAFILAIPAFICIRWLFRLLVPEPSRPKTENEKIEALKRQAIENGITQKAINIAKKIGKEDGGVLIYLDSQIAIALTGTDVAGLVVIQLRQNKEYVFKANYKSIPYYTGSYTSGTHLEKGDDGGYNIVEEVREYSGGGFKEIVLGYIPGDWETHFQRIYEEFRIKNNEETERLRQKEEESKRTSFGL